MIEYVVVSDLKLCVFDTWIKRAAELSTGELDQVAGGGCQTDLVNLYVQLQLSVRSLSVKSSTPTSTRVFPASQGAVLDMKSKFMFHIQSLHCKTTALSCGQTGGHLFLMWQP